MRRHLSAAVHRRDVLGRDENSGPRSRRRAPAATSYVGVEKAIATIREAWSQPGVPQDPNAPGWNELLRRPARRDLREYSQADERHGATDPAEPALPDVARRWPNGRLAACRTRSAKSCGNGCGRGSAWPGPSAGSTRPCAACRPRSDPIGPGQPPALGRLRRQRPRPGPGPV